MANNLDAEIKLLYAADDGTTFTANRVKLGDPFDVIANVEIGEDLMEVVDTDEVFVSVVNLSQAKLVFARSQSQNLAPQKTALNQELRIDVNAGWEVNAAVGDVLEAIATYKVRAGIYTDFSAAKSSLFIVTN